MPGLFTLAAAAAGIAIASFCNRQSRRVRYRIFVRRDPALRRLGLDQPREARRPEGKAPAAAADVRREAGPPGAHRAPVPGQPIARAPGREAPAQLLEAGTQCSNTRCDHVCMCMQSVWKSMCQEMLSHYVLAKFLTSKLCRPRLPSKSPPTMSLRCRTTS